MTTGYTHLVTFALLALALLPASADAAERPSWLKDPSADYPRAVYVTGVGEGPTAEKAADKARAELAKAISLYVESKTRSSASETSNGKASSFEQEVSDEVRTSTAKVLEGVEIARYWDGPSSHFALAVLDRAHSLKVLRDKLSELDTESAELAESLPRTEGKFARLKSALRLSNLLRSRRKLNADYRQLNPEGQGIAASTTTPKALGEARKAVAALTIRVEAEGDQADSVATRLIDGLASRGLRASQGGAGTPDLIIEARARAKALHPEDLTWYWAKGSLSVRVSRGSTGEVVTSFEVAGQDAARDPGSSVDVVLASLSEKTAARLFRFIVSGDILDD